MDKWRRTGEKKLLEWRNGGALAKSSCWSEERRRSGVRSGWSREDWMEQQRVSSAASGVDKSSESFDMETQGVSPHVRGSPCMTSQQRMGLT